MKNLYYLVKITNLSNNYLSSKVIHMSIISQSKNNRIETNTLIIILLYLRQRGNFIQIREN